jgi:DNA-binding NarL/FixJ family response regulator
MPPLSIVPNHRSAREPAGSVAEGNGTVPMAASMQAAPSPLRVFLVEDSALFRERLSESLGAAGNVKVVGWEDSEQPAIAALKMLDWDVVILDLHLRHGSGMGVLKSLQEMGRRAGTTVIVLTDHDFFLYRSKTLESGADLFFVKSREASQVIKLIRDMGARHAAAPR